MKKPHGGQRRLRTVKGIRRIFCAFAAAALIATCSCTHKGGAEIIRYSDMGKTVCSFDSGFIYFWISIQKSVYTAVADSYENGWEHIVDEENGTTLYDLLMTESVESAKKLLAVEYMHDKAYKLSLTDAQKDSVSSQLEKLVSQYGSENALDSALSQFGADRQTLKRYYELAMKQNNLYEYFYGENGIYKIDEQLKKDYFENNYSIADHIFFNTASSDGASDEEKSAFEDSKRQLAKSVYDMIKNAGEDFAAMKAKYNEDTFADSYYPKGFFVTNDSTFPAEFTSAVMSMKPGEISYAEAPGKGIHIIRELEMDSSLYNAYDSVLESITNALAAEDFSARIDEYAKNVYCDESAVESYDPAVIPAFALGR